MEFEPRTSRSDVGILALGGGQSPSKFPSSGGASAAGSTGPEGPVSPAAGMWVPGWESRDHPSGSVALVWCYRLGKPDSRYETVAEGAGGEAAVHVVAALASP